MQKKRNTFKLPNLINHLFGPIAVGRIPDLMRGAPILCYLPAFFTFQYDRAVFFVALPVVFDSPAFSGSPDPRVQRLHRYSVPLTVFPDRHPAGAAVLYDHFIFFGFHLAASFRSLLYFF